MDSRDGRQGGREYIGGRLGPFQAGEDRRARVLAYAQRRDLGVGEALRELLDIALAAAAAADR